MTNTAPAIAIRLLTRSLSVDQKGISFLKKLRPTVIESDGHGQVVLFDVAPHVAIELQEDLVLLSRVDFEWEGPATCRPRLIGPIEISVDRIREEGPEILLAAIADLRTRQLERASFCMYCGTLVMPYERDDEYCCMGCSERHLGVVH